MKPSLTGSSRLRKGFRVLLGSVAGLLIIAIVVTIAYLASPGVRTTVDTKVRPFLFGSITITDQCSECRAGCIGLPDPSECVQQCVFSGVCAP